MRVSEVQLVAGRPILAEAILADPCLAVTRKGIDYRLVDGIPRRPLHSAEHNLGGHLANVGELSGEDLAALTNVLDGLVAKSRLKTLAGGLS